jgi:hypothetical protein
MKGTGLDVVFGVDAATETTGRANGKTRQSSGSIPRRRNATRVCFSPGANAAVGTRELFADQYN